MKFVAPCSEFSHFAADRQDKKLPAEELKDTLQFLGKGWRGFLLVLSEDQDPATVRSGDKVFEVAVE